MNTFLINYDTCFLVINAENKQELFDIIIDNDDNFNLEYDKLHYKFDDYNEEVIIEDVTDKKGIVFGGSFG